MPQNSILIHKAPTLLEDPQSLSFAARQCKEQRFTGGFGATLKQIGDGQTWSSGFFGKPQYGSSAADLSFLLLASATVCHMYVYIELLEAPFAREMGVAGGGGPNKAPYQASHCL